MPAKDTEVDICSDIDWNTKWRRKCLTKAALSGQCWGSKANTTCIPESSLSVKQRTSDNGGISVLLHNLVGCKWRGRESEMHPQSLCAFYFMLFTYIELSWTHFEYKCRSLSQHVSIILTTWRHICKKCFCLREPVFWGRIFLILRRNFPYELS